LGNSPKSYILCADVSEHSVCSIFIGGPTSFRLVQVIIEPNLYLYKYPSNLLPVILLAYTTYEDGIDRVFWNVGT